ncbi:hypothetical protein SAMN04488540_10649 [Ferrimonas sediminum]|uniref:Secreted protein n=1 Tax=Ferrimonas sediminum TaxID=718193 RepID=A0A1G8S214_9GAMM|nr:hypothetical protein [Ferrimonas sediminum]SDJ23277.1 hypothetical protein SAMN04488540_10649 [Ferrimonas sediminum]
MATRITWLVAATAVWSGALLAQTSESQLFFDALSAHCGKAYAGSLISGDAADQAMAGAEMVMHVRDCSDSEIRIPFFVGDDRSRTWVITKTDDGLQLKHQHRHADGSDDEVTWYGGHTDSSIGTDSAKVQSFPVDNYSIAMFERTGLGVSVTNVWQLKLNADRFNYSMSRSGRHFEVSFSLAEPVPVPPEAW